MPGSGPAPPRRPRFVFPLPPPYLGLPEAWVFSTRGRRQSVGRLHPPPARGERALDAAIRPDGGHLEPVPLADRAGTARAVGEGARRDRAVAPDVRRGALRAGRRAARRRRLFGVC